MKKSKLFLTGIPALALVFGLLMMGCGSSPNAIERQAGAHLDRGAEYYNKDDYDRAIAEWSEAIRLIPDYAEAYYYRGSAYVLKEDYDQAFTDFAEAIRLDPDYAEAYFVRGVAYMNKVLVVK